MSFDKRQRRIDIIFDYAQAYRGYHGVNPLLEYDTKDKDVVWIRHRPEIDQDDIPIRANVFVDLPIWADYLRDLTGEKAYVALLWRMLPVNTHEVFAYELQSSEGSK